MPDAEAAASGRPLCRCHRLPCDRDGHGRFHCAERRRERQRAAYAADPAVNNYARVRRQLRARIAFKRAQIEDLESR